MARHLENIMKTLTIVALLSSVLLASAPADARSCRNSHGRHFHCHRVIKPRINFHRHPAIRIGQCRAHRGPADNKC